MKQKKKKEKHTQLYDKQDGGRWGRGKPLKQRTLGALHCIYPQLTSFYPLSHESLTRL